MYESNDKMVSHPDHYSGSMGVQAIDFIHEICRNIYEGMVITDSMAYAQPLLAFDLGQVVKYICRYPKKNGVQDVEKALWYMQDFMEEMWPVADKTSAEIKAKDLYDVREYVLDYLNSSNGKTLGLWIVALTGQQSLEYCDTEGLYIQNILTLCYMLSTNYRGVRYALYLSSQITSLRDFLLEKKI